VAPVSSSATNVHPVGDIEYGEALAVLRRRRFRLLFCLGAWMPAAVLGYAVTQSDTAIWALGIVLAVLTIYSGAVVMLSRCPRCGRTFHLSVLMSHPWTRTCLHCSLPIASKAEPRGWVLS
jgi:hypothetical protein